MSFLIISTVVGQGLAILVGYLILQASNNPMLAIIFAVALGRIAVRIESYFK